jgi:hypothetical protein
MSDLKVTPTPNEFNLTDNKVSIPIRKVIQKFNKGYFDDLFFSTCGGIDDMLDKQDQFRRRINKYFNTNSQPNMYGIILLLLFYKIDPTLCSTFTTWERFAEQLRFEIPLYGVKYPNREGELKCLCGHLIDEVFVVSQNGMYAIMGSTCINKSNIYNQQELEKITRLICDDCGKDCPRPKPYDLTQDICKRCINKKIKKNIYKSPHAHFVRSAEGGSTAEQNFVKGETPLTNTVAKTQECLGCKKSIEKNKYRPRCISCYIKYQNKPFVKMIEV